MKRTFFFSIMIAFILTAFTSAQVSSATTYFKVKEVGNATIVEWSFTLDSLTALASPTFSLDPGAYDFVNQPYTIYKKFVSTYGVPIVDIFLQDVGFSTTDTMTVDTLVYQSVAETDSMGVSSPLFSTTGKQMALGMMKIYARCLLSDVNSGKIRAVFPKRGR